MTVELVLGLIVVAGFVAGYCSAVPLEKRNAPHKFRPTEVHPWVHRATDKFVETFFLTPAEREKKDRK